MAYLNLASRNFQVLVGGSSLDISNCVDSIVLADEPIEFNGLALTKGQLTLNVYAPYAGTTLVDLGIFNRGTKIIVNVLHNGSYTRHPRGWMYVSDSPPPVKSDQAQVTVELECLLSLLNFRSPADGEKFSNIYEPKRRDQIIENLLSAAGVGAYGATVEVSGLADTLDHDFFKSGEVGYVELAGYLAFVNSHYIYAANNNTIQARRYEGGSVAPYALTGRDEWTFEPLQSSERPPDRVAVATSVYRASSSDRDTTSNTTIIRAPRSAVFGGGNTSEIVVEISTVEARGLTQSESTVTEEKQQPLGLLLPDQYPNNQSLILSQRNTTKSYYTGGGGKLDLVVRTSRQLKGVVLPDFFAGNTELFNARQERVTYKYEDEATIETTTTIYEPQGIVNPAAYDSLSNTDPPPSPETLVPSSVDSERYQRVTGGWMKTTRSTRFKAGQTSPTTTASFSSTSNQPPAPERQQQLAAQEEKPITGEKVFRTNARNMREREYRLPGGLFPVDRTGTEWEAKIKKELDGLADLIGRFLQGRWKGYTWITDLDSFWFGSYSPIVRWSWQDGSTVRTFAANGLTFAITEDQCTVGADGILLGLSNGITVLPTTFPTPSAPPDPPPTPTEPTPTNYSVTTNVGAFAGIQSIVLGGFVSLPYDLVVSSEVGAIAANTTEALNYSLNAGTVTSNVGAFGRIGANPIAKWSAVPGIMGIDTSISSGGSSAVAGGVAYTGNETSRSLSVDADGQSPDWVAIYDRNNDGTINFFDSVRGATKMIDALGSSEFTVSDSLTSFDVDGFSLGVDAGSIANVNKTGRSYMAWTLVEDSLFDIVTYTGDGTAGKSIAHSLGAAPNVIMVNRVGTGDSWIMYHASLGNAAGLELGASATNTANLWNSQSPSSSVFYVGDDSLVNNNGDTYIAYLWATSAGSYTGDGNNPGVAVTTATAPTRVWLVTIDNTLEPTRTLWTIFDNIRNPSNPRDKAACISDASNTFTEVTGTHSLDFGTGGFTPNDGVRVNRSGQTYYWWLF